MNLSTMFDYLLTLFMFGCALVIIVAVAGIIDSYLDPHCNCADIRRQENETRGVTK